MRLRASTPLLDGFGGAITPYRPRTILVRENFPLLLPKRFSKERLF